MTTEDALWLTEVTLTVGALWWKGCLMLEWIVAKSGLSTPPDSEPLEP